MPESENKIKQDIKYNENFYKELDQQKQKSSCCTCHSLSILFLIIIVGLVALTYTLYLQAKKIVFEPTLPSISKVLNLNSEISELLPNQNNELALTLSNEDLTSLLGGGINLQNLIFKQLQAEIFTDQIIIKGQMIKPLSLQVVFYGDLQIIDNKLSYKINKMQTGNLYLPQIVYGQIENSVNTLLDQKMAPVYQQFNLQRVDNKQGELVLYGTRKR